MILTVSHISFIINKNSPYKVDLEDYLKKNDFMVNGFFEGVKNPQIKSKFCRRFSPIHDLCLWKDRIGNQFEIVYLEGITENFSPSFYPISKCASFEVGEKKPVSTEGKSKRIESVFGRIYSLGTFSNEGLFGVLYETTDIEASLCLWTAVGFTLVTSNLEKAILEFRSITGKAFNLVLIKISEDNQNNIPYFDQPGLRSIAVVATDIREAQKRILELGFTTTPVDEVTVGTNRFEVAFIFGKNNEIIEILKLTKRNF
ncbi:MAG TPA: hypothetical protein PKW59_13480 [Thermotogota bacterium]|nr:hypothetical protein [Thermotogota bacterium]